MGLQDTLLTTSEIQAKLLELYNARQVAHVFVALDNDENGQLRERISNLTGDVLKFYIRETILGKNALAKQVNAITEKDLIKITSACGTSRLDIGVHCVKNEVPASHDSWATRLVIKRLDGPSEGVVQSDHVVGIFSENGQHRLDVGVRAMKKNGPPSHESWATRLNIKRLGEGKGPLMYNEIVGVFSECGNKRLDIGERSMKENVPAAHNSWATSLKISKIN